MSSTNSIVRTAEKREYYCPYCSKKNANPDIILLHVINNHPCKVEDFKNRYFKEMIGIFKRIRLYAYGIAIYLTAIFIILGLICFYTWQESDIFEVIGWSWTEPPNTVNPKTLQTVIYSICAGGIGSISYSLWALVEHYCRFNDFDTVWTAWYLTGPISGSIAGIATYAIIVGGLFVLGNDITLRSNWSIFAFSFLAGFSTKKALRKLYAIAGQIFQQASATTTEEEKEEKKDQE